MSAVVRNWHDLFVVKLSNAAHILNVVDHVSFSNKVAKVSK